MHCTTQQFSVPEQVNLYCQCSWHGIVLLSADTSCWVQELGADDVIDYTQQTLQEVCKSRDKFDGVVDSVGGQTESDSYALLTSKGSFVEVLNAKMGKIALASHLASGLVGWGPRQVSYQHGCI